MKTWFIKKDYEKEFEERKKENDNIYGLSEQMCNEGKGASFLNVNPNNAMILFKLLSQYRNNNEYFEVSEVIDPIGEFIIRQRSTPIKVNIAIQSMSDIESLNKPYEPKKVKEYKEKAKKAMQKKRYKKAYKLLHKAKIYKQPPAIVDEFWMV